MIALIFEVIPNEGKRQDYLDIAASLRPELDKIEGFISIERFQSLYDPEKFFLLLFRKKKKRFGGEGCKTPGGAGAKGEAVYI